MSNICGAMVAWLTGVGALLLVGQSAHAGGEVWVARASGTELVRLDAAGNTLVAATLPGSVFGVAVEGTGAAWAARTDVPVVHRVGLDGTLSSIEVGAVVRSLAVGADGSVWAVRPALADVVRFDPTGAILGVYPVGPVPYGIAIDVLGQVWVTNTYGASVTRIDPVSGQTVDFAVDLFPTGIAAHGDGSVWVVSKESVQRLSPTGSVIFSATAGWHSRGVAVDADGQVWVTNELSSDVHRFASDGSGLGVVTVGQRPWGIAARGAGGVYVLCSLGDGIWSLGPNGDLDGVIVADAPHAFGDLTGLARAAIVDPNGDADADGHSNAFELEHDFDPLAADSMPVLFLRGDCDANGAVGLADGVQILGYLFESAPVACLEAADVNDDGCVTLLDAVSLFGFLAQGGTPPPAPFPTAGYDPAPRDGLACP
ncbi:MAG: hypothetical protein AB7O52_09435 [Planctomycetota bacterium]